VGRTYGGAESKLSMEEKMGEERKRRIRRDWGGHVGLK
jgi:hypothetical protein